ncbi:DUF4386 family protein [Vibrio pacinii]|uniref:DUF4386 family protein n=1 Tax=Vibrio pacinii TaxID=170674 RepID=UPI00056E092A|nr:DUF4386 family protein [Vibrio pacinii]
MDRFQKFVGAAAWIEALIYVFAFVYFGAFWAYPPEGSASEKMTYLAENQFSFSMMYFLMYVVFGVFLSVLVVGLFEKLESTNDPLVKIGSVFGFVWVVLVIASGMLANIGLVHAVELMDQSAEKAFDMWRVVTVIIESLGGGNELVGGLWVLLLSLAALKATVFPRGLNYLGISVGCAGISTIYPAEVLNEIFGITQVLWFFWLGVSMLGQHSTSKLADS